MITTGCIPTNTVVPYRNEIKKWSREGRSNLAELIEVSLEEEAPTNEDINKFLDGLDADLMKKTAEYAHKQYLEGKCILHSEVMSRIMEEMGWK